MMRYVTFILLICLTSVCFSYSQADFDLNGVVDLDDFAVFSNEWLSESEEPEAYGFVVTVAANNSSAKAKQAANYVCDGINDDVEIQAAIDGLPNGGGKVVLSQGNFSISSAINLYRPDCNDWFNVWLCGQGLSATVIEVADGANCNGIENVATSNNSGWKKLSDMTVKGNRNNNTYGYGYFSKRSGGVTYDSNIWNVFFAYWSNACIYISGGWHIHIHDVWVEMSDSDGIWLQGSECKLSNLQISTLGGTGLHLLGNRNVITNCVIRDIGCDGVYLHQADHSSLSNLSIAYWGQTAPNAYSAVSMLGASGYNCISNVSVNGDGTNKSYYGITIYNHHNLVSNVSVHNVYDKSLRIIGDDNIVSDCYFEPGIDTLNTVSDTGSRNRIVDCSGAGHEETVTASSTTLSHWGVTKLDASTNIIDAILPDGQYLGEIKIIVMVDASNPCTVSVSNHETSDPEIGIFDAVDQIWNLMWTGNNWATIKASCTF